MKVEVSQSAGNQSSYGIACGMTFASAHVLCRQLGYDFGSVTSASCSQFGGSSICGAVGTPVALKNLRCRGGELNVAECSFEAAHAECAAHDLDSVVYCCLENASPFADGAVRLVDGSGAPALTLGSRTTGRLEVFLASSGAWAPVSKAGFGSGAAAVACKWMGFGGQAGSANCKEADCGFTPLH